MINTGYLELMEHAAKYIVKEKPRMHGPEEVAAFLRPLVQGALQEQFYVFLLNAKNGLINFECVTIGLVDRSHIHAREVFRNAIMHCATRILLAHNHPSGDPTPSAPDIECTRNLVNAGKIIGIDVIDHIVVGQKSVKDETKNVRPIDVMFRVVDTTTSVPTFIRPKDWLSFRESNYIKLLSDTRGKSFVSH
jgi:DNA repair protein RadC